MIDAPCQPRYDPGPTATRPLDGFNPIKPEKDAGIRIEPPPSDPKANGTIPAFKAAAAPPLEPPGLRFKSIGLFTWPKAFESLIPLKPNSGTLVRPIMTKPALTIFSTKYSVTCIVVSFVKLDPLAVRCPA